MVRGKVIEENLAATRTAAPARLQIRYTLLMSYVVFDVNPGACKAHAAPFNHAIGAVRRPELSRSAAVDQLRFDARISRLTI
jgi:hypothetical protein